MKITIHKPAVDHPCFTPYGVIDKNFTASAKLNKGDDFSIEYEVEFITNDFGTRFETGFAIKKLTVISESKAPPGVTTTHLREIPLMLLLEAAVHKAIYPGTAKTQMEKFSAVMKVSEKQLRASQIILSNPGESHARLLMEEFGISEGSARNLKTRVLKSGLIPHRRTSEPALPTFDQMSEEGDYLRQVLEGKIKDPLPPSQWFALQEQKKKKRSAPNRKGKK